jgi:two-component system sensor kinase FixL
VVFCDISERRRIKAEVERREEEIRALHNQLTRSSQRTAMENLSSVIAHELGQPLSAIVNAAGALRRTAEAADESSPPDERISFIQEQADRASAIIGGMRRVFGPGHQDFAVESIDGIVADVCAVSGVKLNRRKISLEIETAERLPEIRVNRIQIQQVVYNLLRNAAEALSDTPKPEIRVQTSAIEDGGILIRIQDNGPGVDIDMLPRLFEPFQTSKSEGMGMGLYTCRTIIEAHGGTITPLSEPGRGTAFEIRLPAKP